MRASPATNVRNLIPERLSPAHLRFGLMIGLFVLTVMAFTTYLFLAIEWRQTPFLGATLNQTMTVNASVSNGTATWPGKEAGLRAGDQILTIDGHPVLNNLGQPVNGRRYYDILSDYEIGDEITISFEYNTIRFPAPRTGTVLCGEPNEDGIARCEVSYKLIRIPDADFIAFFLAPFLAGIIVLVIIAGLLYFRALEEDTFIAVMVLIPLSLAMGAIFDAGSTHRLVPLWYIGTIGTGFAFISLGIIFPRPIPIVRRQPLYRFVPAGIALALSIYAVASYNDEGAVALPTGNQVATVSAIVGLAILAAMMGFYHRRVATTRTQRDQANVVMMGALLGLSPAAFWIAGRLFPSSSALLLSIESTLPFLITPALSIAYAVIQVNRFDTDRAVSQGITYFILLIALGIGYSFLVFGGTLFATEIIQADNPLLIVLTIFLISLLFVPVRTNLQGRVDRIFYRERHDYQTRLEEFSQTITSLAAPNVIIEAFRTILDETIKPINTLIFLRNPQTGDYVAYGDPNPETDITFSEASGVIRLLKNSDSLIHLELGQPLPPELHTDKVRLGIIKVVIIAGMAGERALNGFIAIGPPRSGADSYRFEEQRFVRNLVGQLSIAIERLTVIQSLEGSVNELGVLSQVSQAVNFTIETEDLMELLSAQTLRLMRSPYFYIVLYNLSQDQLSYAFFQESDERHNEYENRRWPIGRDLYSEVIINQQPIRVSDYAQTMTRRGYIIRFEDPATRAWMAVPLAAGGRVLGLIAVSNTEPEFQYSADQLRIMGDIGALAAAALDKSRLFTEANARARQLAVLNDISRQLVATEGDVERLLDLVTASAVDILLAEAGSLLLTADDGSGDLEFKVAVGGTGQELVGKRLEKGFGLVGRVAKTGRPIISNDTSTDTDWDGEVSEGFRTKSILAVPLIAQDKVIGVLEVINKKDGSIYVEEDVELLTTFAGQAAIAFENARLFQQTDLQLAQRVRELEAMERIDRELNRSLDLEAVAEITVRYAISSSNATAGLLGIPDEDKRFLHIVAKQGYGEEDVPEGAEEGNRWPMNRGIISRVLRTRRPDLQPYVAMDPDYIPSLRKSLSQITIPMVTSNEIGAILILETDREPRLNLLDQDWIQRLTDHASIAIENAKLYEEITRANETKSEFMGFAAHELKNPLTSVKGYASTLGSSMASAMSPDQIAQFAAIIQNNADRMQGIIDDLRDIARDDAGKLTIDLEPMQFRSVVMDALITLQKQVDGKNQTVINQVAETLPLVMGDAKRLTQIMVNFISNAHKYSPEEATIWLNAEVIQRYINGKGQNLGEMMHISVRDNGIGMKPETLNALFKEDYFRSDNKAARAQEGTGLGMVITKRLIEGHNGEVWVESEYDKGSTFHFVIPVAPKHSAPSTETRTPESEPEGASD